MIGQFYTETRFQSLKAASGIKKLKSPFMAPVNSEAQADEDKKFLVGMEILYEDKYCKLTNSQLNIKWYYFPFGTKTLNYDEIKSFGRATDFDIGILSVKAWGMSLAPIWWALGPMGRVSNLGNEIILTVRGSSIKCGFSSMDVPAVLRILSTKVADLPGLIRVDTARLK